MPTPDAIHALADRFRANLDSYKRGVYNETQVRREFLECGHTRWTATIGDADECDRRC